MIEPGIKGRAIDRKLVLQYSRRASTQGRAGAEAEKTTAGGGGAFNWEEAKERLKRMKETGHRSSARRAERG